VDGNKASRIFQVDGGVQAALTNLTVTNGKWASGNFFEGGIYNHGTLTVSNSTLSHNSSDFTTGGGIDNSGTLTVTNCTLSGNSANRFGGGIFNSRDRVTVVNSTLTGNVADADGNGDADNDSGGGIWTRNGNFTFTTLHNTIVAGNRRGKGDDAPPTTWPARTRSAPAPTT
jgi:hypothetical protein